MPSSLLELFQIAVDSIGTVLHSHTAALLIIAGYLLINVLAYFLTKGREFAFAGWTGALLLIPFIKW
jgi:hypothetical protein